MASIDLAISEDAAKELVVKLTEEFEVSTSGSSNGRFRASYNAGVKLAGGRIDLRNNPDELRINELDVIYDPLNVSLEVDIPEVCVGGFCIIPNPFGGCIVRAPRICLFEADPDITIPINLDGLIQSEISGGFNVNPVAFANPDGAGMNRYEALAADALDKWRFHLEARWIDLDIIDVADSVGNIIDAIVDNLMSSLFGGLPGWAQDLLGWILNGVSDIVRDILDIGDDIDEWISDLLGVSFGLFDFIIEKVGNYFADLVPLYEIDNPYPILDGPPAVMLPISEISIDIKDDELVIGIEP